jgi:hypothetical protein
MPAYRKGWTDWVGEANRASQQANPPKKAVTNIPKVEGTTQTWGQKISRSIAPAKNTASTTTTAFRKGSLRPTSNARASLSSVQTTQAIKAVAVTPFKTNTWSFGRQPFFSKRFTTELTRVKFVSQTDKLRRAVDRFGNVSSLSCKAKSNIASAAASSNRGATVVLPEDRLSTDPPNDLFQTLLGSIARVTPKVEEFVLVEGSFVKSKESIREALIEAQKVDLSISLKSKRSESIEVNTLKTPNLEAKLVYNFFTEDEEDVEVQEDQSRDPLLTQKPYNVPRYVDLRWSPTVVTEQITAVQKQAKKNEAIRKESFFLPKGVQSKKSENFSQSTSRAKKRERPLVRDGVRQRITDIHNLNKAFDSVNNRRRFANSIPAVLNIGRASRFGRGRRNNPLAGIPIKSMRTR